MNLLTAKVTRSNYPKLAIRTLSPLEGVSNDAHMALGVIGEYGELQKAINNNDNKNTREELGDMLWYIGVHCDLRNIDFENILKIAEETHLDQDFFDEQGYDVYGYVDFIKKSFAYHKVLDKLQLSSYLCNILRYVYNETYWRDETFSIDNIMAINISKLRFRFSKKFTTEEALNRDLSKEETTFGDA